MFQIGSPLSFYMNPVGFTTNITNILNYLCLYLPYMNCLNYLWVSSVTNMMSQMSQRTGFSLKMKELFLPLFKLLSRTQEIVKQLLCEFRKNSRKNCITTCIGHRVFLRKRNFQTLGESFFNQNLESDLPAATRDAFRHWRIYEPAAREKCPDVMKFHLNRNIDIWET